MKIPKYKGFEDIGHMENKIKEIWRELSIVRHREVVAWSQLEIENELLRRQLQENEAQLACMAS